MQLLLWLIFLKKPPVLFYQIIMVDLMIVSQNGNISTSVDFTHMVSANLMVKIMLNGQSQLSFRNDDPPSNPKYTS